MVDDVQLFVTLNLNNCREATFLKVCRTACFHYMVEDVCLSVCLSVRLSVCLSAQMKFSESKIQRRKIWSPRKLIPLRITIGTHG